jgi:hypothetical protein
MYPLLVACKSISILRQRAAQEVVDKIRQHSGGLVDQVSIVDSGFRRKMNSMSNSTLLF